MVASIILLFLAEFQSHLMEAFEGQVLAISWAVSRLLHCLINDEKSSADSPESVSSPDTRTQFRLDHCNNRLLLFAALVSH